MLGRGQEGILVECSDLCPHVPGGQDRDLSQSKTSDWWCLWHGHSQMLSAKLSPLAR